MSHDLAAYRDWNAVPAVGVRATTEAQATGELHAPAPAVHTRWTTVPAIGARPLTPAERVEVVAVDRDGDEVAVVLEPAAPALSPAEARVALRRREALAASRANAGRIPLGLHGDRRG